MRTRKTVNTPVDDITNAPAPEETPVKKTTRAKKVAEPAAPVVEVVAEEAKPKRRTPAKKAEVAPVEAEAPKRTSRAKKVVEPQLPLEEAAPEPKKATRTAKKPSETVAEVASKKKPAPVTKPSEVVAAPKPAARKTPRPSETVSEITGKPAPVKKEVAPKAEAPAARPARAPRAPRPSETIEEMVKVPFVKLSFEDSLAAVTSDFPIPTWRPKVERVAIEEKSGDFQEHPASRSRKNRRRRGKDTPVTAADALEPRGDSVEEAPVAETQEQQPRNDRRDRGGRRRDDRPRREEAASEEEEPKLEKVERIKFVPAKKEPEPPATREVVPIPEDAPQVISRDGVVTLVRNKRVIPPVFFFSTAPDERRLNNVLEEIRYASENGVNNFIHLVELEVDRGSVNDAVGFAGYMLKKTLEINPEAQVMFRVVFVAKQGWEKEFPRAKFTAEGGGIAEPSFSDDDYWKTAEECLVSFVNKVRQLDGGKNILGVHLERGEWFFADGWGYDTSVAAQDKFREWLKVRYRNDTVTIRAAWFDGQVQFDTVSIPQYRKSGWHNSEEFVRTDRKARRWVDYHLFMSDVIVERITQLAFAAKKASEGYFLIGVSYGYTFEWSHPANGHLSLGKLLRVPEVDFIAGPPSYKNREPGGTAAYPTAIDSVALNGKLFISEEDFKTPISGRQEPDDFNPVIKTPQALDSVHWRGAGGALAHQSGVCWMDLWGNGWLSTPSIWERAKRIREAMIRRGMAPPTDPEVAVYIDERSLAYLVDRKAFKLLVQDVREAVLRSGMSVGFYLLSDLAHREKFPESKLNIFVNAWDLRPEVRQAIKTRLQKDDKVLFWLYAAGLFDGGREAIERVREVTGIALKPQPFACKPGTTLVNRRHPLSEALPEKLMQQGGQLEPSYFAIPEESEVLGEYSQTGLPSFVSRRFASDRGENNGWTSVFLGEPIVTPALLKALGQVAGAHVWNYHEDLVHVRPPFLTVHCTQAGTRMITLPDKWSAYNLTSDEWMHNDGTHLRFAGIDGMTYTFLVGPRAEIEAILQSPLDNFVEVDHIPARSENTIRLDQINFDVSIVKLDEFMEESWSDEYAEDLLLKPSQLEIEDPGLVEPEAPRERRRRSGSPKKRGSASEAPAPSGMEYNPITGEIEMNVVFRKRD